MQAEAAVHYLRHLLPPIAEAPQGARFARCVFEPPAAGMQDYPSTFAKRHAVGFLQPRESVCKVGSTPSTIETCRESIHRLESAPRSVLSPKSGA
jgi:hypothetical protein